MPESGEITPTVDQAQATASTPEQRVEALPKAFQDSDYSAMREKAIAKGAPFAALFTDIDNTFYRSDKKEASAKLFNTANLRDIPITAITGNDFKTVLDRIQKGELPYFPAIGSSVGTEIWVLHTNPDGTKNYMKDEDFEASLLAKGYDRPAVAKLSASLIDQSKAEHPSWQLDYQVPDVEKAYLTGENVGVDKFKTSFYAMAASSQDVEAMRASFQDRFPNQKIVLAEEINYNSKLTPGQPKKFCIDVLPVTKADSVNYIAQGTKVDVAGVAGDSGNDSQMLTGAGDIAFVVGGAKPELREDIARDLGETGKNSGKRFARVEQEMPDGSKKTKIYYQERGGRLGPESILDAAMAISTAQRMIQDSKRGQNPPTQS